jgi:flagellar basal body-associated protein FliL
MNTKQPSSKKSWIILGVVVVIALIAYFYYTGGQVSPAAGTLVTSDSSAVVGAQVLDLLSEISTLKIDTSLFSDRAYQTLVDHTVPIPAQQVGRVNPFAPLPGEAVTAAAATGAAGTH